MTKKEKLEEKFTEIKQLNPEILSDLNKMIRLYSQAQLIIGHLDADAFYEYGQAYSKRKEMYASAIMYTEGTGVEKEATAEIEVAKLREKEWQLSAESRRYKNLFKAMDNLIIALRRDEKTAMAEYQKVNDIYGGG